MSSIEILTRYLTLFFTKEDPEKLSHVSAMAQKWINKLHDLDKVLVKRYGKTVLYHSFFKVINLRNICSQQSIITEEWLMKQKEIVQLSQEFVDILKIPFTKNETIPKYVYISMFELSYTPLCIITASYNAAKLYQDYFDSILSQNYVLYRIMYVNDASTDHTGKLIEREIKNTEELRYKCNVIHNSTNKKQAYSKHKAYTRADPNEVLVFIDGDDKLSHTNVFHFLDFIYSKYPSNQITCGSFATMYQQNIEYNDPQSITSTDELQYTVIPVSKCRRDTAWKYSHLRTGYAKLFQNIPLQHLQDTEGNWIDCCTDVAEMYWALDQCKQYIRIHNVLLLYNKDNSILYSNSFYNQKNKEHHEKTLARIKNMKYPIPVDSIHIINLERRQDRKQYLEKQLSKYISQPYTYFSAVDGHDKAFSKTFEKYKKYYDSEQTILSTGALGLLASYCTLLGNILQDETNESVLILEDDVLFHTDFRESLSLYTEQFQNYDIVYLGANQQDWSFVKHADNGYTVTPAYFKWTYGTFGMVLKRRVIEDLYVELCSKPIFKHNLPIDCFLNVLSDKNNYSVFVCSPNLLIADLSTSDIQDARDMKKWAKQLKWNLDEYEPHASSNTNEEVFNLHIR